MRRLMVLAALVLSARGAFAQRVAETPSGIAVAHDGVIELFEGGASRWRVDGVRNATAIAAGADRVAVLDALANEAVVVTLRDGQASRLATGETPAAAVFSGSDLWILSRDAGVVQRAGGETLDVGTDAAFLRASAGRVYVYSRVAGRLTEIAEDRIVRTAAVPPYASDLEIAGTTAFLALPREGKIAVVDLEAMKPAGEVAVGAVPVDLAIARGGTALTARILAVADPSAKRVWMTESTQSTTKAFFRGFLRGFLGLGLFGGRSSQFPTGVDRVERAGSVWAAYDSSSGTLYRFSKRKSSVVAKDVAPGGWAATADGIAWWDGSAVRVAP